MPTTKFYPSLTTLVDLDKIPVIDIGFLQDALNNVFNDLYYKDFMIQASSDGSSVHYNITIISYQRLAVEIPGTNGLALVLNPNGLSTESSAIPISFGYRIEGLKYVKGFDISSFSQQPIAYFNLFLNILGIDKKKLLQELIEVFLGAETSPYDEFVAKFNEINDESIELINSTSTEEVLTNLADNIENLDIDIFTMVYDDFLSEGSLNLDEIITKIKLLFSRILGEIDFKDILAKFIPQLDFSINSIVVALEFPRSIFVPVETGDIDNNPSTAIGDPLPEPYKSQLSFNVGSIAYSTDKGFDINLSQTPNINFPKSFILGTKFTLQLDDLKLDLSRTKNIPEAIADGRPDDFIGVYIKNGVVGFPAEWGHNPAGSTGELFVENLLAGTGGISGTIGLRGSIITPAVPATGTSPAIPAVRVSNPLISVKFGEKFTATLDYFSITFQQNAIIASDIRGSLTVAGFKDSMGNDAKVDIKIHIDGNGDFYITASEEDGIPLPLHFDQYFTVTVNSLTIGKKSNKFFLALSGVVDFKDLSGSNSFIGGLLPKDIELQKLLIWENGQIELEGGVVTLRKPVKINLGPVKLTVTALGMGSYERQHGGQLRKYKYVEFSAGISINPAGIDARGDGIKVYFSIDGGPVDIFVRIESIAIDLIIPGSASKEQATLLLSGYLSMKQPTGANSDAGTEFSGGIEFILPKLKMGGSAAMKYNPKTPAFLIDVSLELSTPIVLGATGMGIYGFRALFGKHYVVSRTEPPVSLAPDAEWWQYYKKKVPTQLKEGVTTEKMANLPGFSFGAGVSLATAADGGKTFSSKLFFLLSLPEVFLLQGQAQILKERIGLSSETDPPFYAIIAIDKNSISAGLGVNYKFPDSGGSPGKIATVDALIEMAYFFHDSSAWYLNIGRDQPVDRRVRARIFDLFDVYSYFMLSASGIKAGAGASLEKKYKAGPITARLYAYMDTAGRLAFKPVQIGGSIDIGGGVDIKVCGKGFSLTASASLAAEAPKPFIVTGSVEVCVKVLKKEYCIDLDFTWTFDQTLDFSEIPVVTAEPISQGGAPVVSTRLQQAVKSLNMMSEETLNVLCIENISVSGSSASSIPLLSDGVWSSINDYILPLDSFIDIEFRKPVKPYGDPTLTRFGGTTSGANNSVYVAPQRGKSNRVRHDFVLNKVEIFSWDPTGSGSWAPYHVYNAITPLNIPPFNLTAPQLNNLQFGSWQLDSPGNYTKLRLMAQNPMSFLGQGSGDTTPENLGVTNAIFCPPNPKEKICVNYDGTGLKSGETKLIPAENIIQRQTVLMRVTSHDSNVVYKPYSGVKTALAWQDTDALEIYLPEPMPEVSMLLTTLTSNLTIKYYKRIQSGVDASNNPVYGYSLISTVTKTPAQLTGGLLYSNGANPVDKIEIKGGTCNPSKGSNLVCDTGISGEGSDLMQLMNLIVKNKQILQDIKIGDDPKYKPLVSTLSIFPTPLPQSLNYHPTSTSTSLTITLSGQEFNCRLLFNVPAPGKIDWNFISYFQNMRPDPSFASMPGGNYHFLVDVVLNNGTIITLTGFSTCVPTYYCYDKCMNFFYQICYLNIVDFQYNQTLPTGSDVSQNNTNMVDAINKTLIPIWRPDTTFAVRVQYTDEVYEEGSSHGNNARAYVFGFRTKGPIGHFHEYPTGNNTSTKLVAYSNLETNDNEDQYKLSTLKHYIDYSKSYPNADGNILNSKPLYYQNPELLLFYIFPHVYQFYQNWNAYNGAPAVDSSLEVIIKDPIESPFVTNPMNPTGPQISNVVPPANNSWQINSFPVITPDIAALNNMILNGVATGSPCLPSVVPLTPNGINNAVTPATPLEPLKLYTAIYNASYKPASVTALTASQKREVHRYGFQTSMYKDFHTHIQSYVLQRNATTSVIEKAAVYELKKAFAPAVIVKAQQILSDTLPKTDSLHEEAAINFDKLVDRLFEFKELEPAEYVQFNLIINTTTHALLGVLVRSPEPFNDPKTPLAKLVNTLEMEVDTGTGYSSASDYVTYFSKDKSSAFITDKLYQLNISRGLHRFTFRYKLYNGQDYVIKATEQVILDFNNII